MSRFAFAVLAAAVFSLFAVATASAQGYPVMCRGGGNMTTKLGAGSSLIIDFEHAPQGYLTEKPGKGQCAWSDRAMSDGEPSRLVLKEAGKTGDALRKQIKKGLFSVEAFTSNGVLEITGVDLPEDFDDDEAKATPDDDDAPDMMDFSGRWESTTDDGDSYVLSLHQDGKTVSGTYKTEDGRKGTIKGAIKKGVLHFGWKVGKYSGTGEFELSDDGDSFEGSYRQKGGKHDGVWSGTRD